MGGGGDAKRTLRTAVKMGNRSGSGAGGRGFPGEVHFQVCRNAGFQTCEPCQIHAPADLEVGDTAGLETCATGAGGAVINVGKSGWRP